MTKRTTILTADGSDLWMNSNGVLGALADNVLCSRLSKACNAAMFASAGDSIDRGLALLAELKKQGFGVIYLGEPAAGVKAYRRPGFRKCEFCGCNTNAALRACCDKGREADCTAGVKAVPPGGMTAAEYLAKVEADPKRAAALQRGHERLAAGVAVASAYGSTDLTEGIAVGNLPLTSGDKRLVALVLTALGPKHAAMDDLAALLFAARSRGVLASDGGQSNG